MPPNEGDTRVRLASRYLVRLNLVLTFVDAPQGGLPKVDRNSGSPASLSCGRVDALPDYVAAQHNHNNGRMSRKES